MIEINNKLYKTYDLDEIEKEKYHGFIYVTVNKLDNKKYVGQHTKWNEHYMGSGCYFKRAVKKYGIENFERYIIDLAKSQEELDEKETYYINEAFGVNTAISQDWYNIKDGSQSGGNCFLGKSEEEMKEIGERLSEKYRLRVERIGSYPFQGKQHKQESKNKASQKLLGRKKPESMGKKLSESIKGDNHYTRRIGHSKESNEKRSKTLQGNGNHNVNLIFVQLPSGEVIYGYGMREVREKLLEFGYDVPQRSINTASKSKSGIYRKYNLKFWREDKSVEDVSYA